MATKTVASFVGAVVLLGTVSSATPQSPTPGSTQNPPPPTETTSTTTTLSPYESLSPGNQKIVRALYEAQPTTQSPAGTGGSQSTTTSAGTAAEPLTLDQIAEMKQSGQGWGQVFKEMQAQGLVQEKNLGQVVSQYHQKHPAQAPGTGSTITTASGRQYRYGGSSSTASSPGNSQGSTKRGHARGPKAQSTYSGHGSSGTTYTAGGASHGHSGIHGNSGNRGGGSGHGNGGKK